MVRINDNYLKLKAGYLFPEIGRRVKAYTTANPEAKVIRLGIGDVTRPLVPAVVEAFRKGVDDLAKADSFHGYGPEQGYEWLIEIIIEKAYKPSAAGKTGGTVQQGGHLRSGLPGIQ